MLKGCRCFCHESSLKRSFSSNVYDVVISGGGMVGTAAASFIGKQPLLKDKKVLLLESSPPAEYRTPVSYSNRVSALSPSSQRLLQAVGAWSTIEASGRFKPVKSMCVWEACSDAEINFTKSDHSDDSLAYLVENDLTVHALSKSLLEIASTVEVAPNTTVTKYENSATNEQLTEIHLNNGDTISARLVIGADGFNSLARKSANIDVISWKYDQVGVVATLKLDSPEDGNSTAWQRFLPSGPIAILPLSEDTSSLVWSTSPSHAKHLLSLSSESFVDELNHALADDTKKDDIVSSVTDRYREILTSLNLGSNSPKHYPPTILDIDADSRAMFPYGLMHADKYVENRLALVGDACHRVHPLAGQGVNLGFGDVECLVRVLVEAASLGTDIGWIDHLVAYETERQRHVISTTAGIDGLYRLYSNDWTPSVLARSLGLITVNSLPPVKDFFMRRAQS